MEPTFPWLAAYAVGIATAGVTLACAADEVADVAAGDPAILFRAMVDVGTRERLDPEVRWRALTIMSLAAERCRNGRCG